MSVQKLFHDRSDAGRQLAARLVSRRDAAPLVLGLPRGGVLVAYEVAAALGAQLDVWVVRKLGAPGQEELGMGAVAEGGEVFLDARIVRSVGATQGEVSALIERKLAEVEQRSRLLRRGRPPPDVAGRTVILVDDGLATGGTARAALRAIRRRGPKKLVLAVPVASEDVLDHFLEEADEIVCPAALPSLRAVGLWYEHFEETSDDEVLTLLDHARDPSPSVERPVRIDTAEASLQGDLGMPRGAPALVLFAHGSGSGRRSPRNRLVAASLRRRGLATLLFDLLTDDEAKLDARDAHLRFDIGLLARRLLAATDWVRATPETRSLKLGYFGASTGAAAALVAAATRPAAAGAVVSRGGRPDLAADALRRVQAPTLLIVGGDDRDVLALNRQALRAITAPKRLAVVGGATHLFEEPGALEQVAALAGDWFAQHLAAAQREARP